MGRGLATILAAFGVLLSLVLGGALASCSGEPSPSGLDEPLRVASGAFKNGALPGAPPAAEGATGAPPLVTSLEAASTLVRLGQTGKSLVGRTSTDAVAVAVGFADLGTGYWVFPVDAPDPQNNGELTWQATVDFGSNLPSGRHALRVVAIDAAGNAGTQRELGLCVLAAIPDNLNACDPKNAPPSTVFSLSWDSPVDLDLVVVAPDGRTVSAKTPRTTAPTVDAGAADGVGTFDRDSNGACVIDNTNRENLVFQTPPYEGSWLVYANLFDACGSAPVHFTFTLYEAQVTEDPNIQELVPSITKRGTLLDVDANGGASLGTFVTEIPF